MHPKSNAREITHPSTILTLDVLTLKGRRVSIYGHITFHGFLRVKEKILYTHKFEASLREIKIILKLNINGQNAMYVFASKGTRVVCLILSLK